MTKNNENIESPSAKMVRLPPKRGQVKAKMMTQFLRTVEEVGRALGGKEKVQEETHSSQPHDYNHA